ESVCEQLIKRAAFRRVIKMRAESTMSAGARGVKIQISGRLGGGEMSRSLGVRPGSLPPSTLQAHNDYGPAQATMNYGVIGVQVWIYKGMYGSEAAPVDEVQSTAAGGRARARGRR